MLGEVGSKHSGCPMLSKLLGPDLCSKLRSLQCSPGGFGQPEHQVGWYGLLLPLRQGDLQRILPAEKWLLTPERATFGRYCHSGPPNPGAEPGGWTTGGILQKIAFSKERVSSPSASHQQSLLQ